MTTLVTTAALQNLDARRLTRARAATPRLAAAPPLSPRPAGRTASLLTPAPVKTLVTAAALENLASRRRARAGIVSRGVEHGAHGGDTPVAERQRQHAAFVANTSVPQRRNGRLHPPHVPLAADLTNDELVALERAAGVNNTERFLALVFLVETFIGRRIAVVPSTNPPTSVRLIPGPVSEE